MQNLHKITGPGTAKKEKVEVVSGLKGTKETKQNVRSELELEFSLKQQQSTFLGQWRNFKLWLGY